MADNSSPDTRKRSGAQSSDFKPNSKEIPRSGNVAGKGRGEQNTWDAVAGGSSNNMPRGASDPPWKPIQGANGPGGSGDGTTSSASGWFAAHKNRGGSSGKTQDISGTKGDTD